MMDRLCEFWNAIALYRLLAVMALPSPATVPSTRTTFQRHEVLCRVHTAASHRIMRLIPRTKEKKANLQISEKDEQRMR
jgi:hypothetical protein